MSREYLEAQRRFLVERLKWWRSPEEIVELGDLLTKLAHKIAAAR
jgi:hypothetical protein